MTAGARLLLLLPFTALLGVFFAAPLALMSHHLSRQSFASCSGRSRSHYARFFSDAYYIGVLWTPSCSAPSSP